VGIIFYLSFLFLMVAFAFACGTGVAKANFRSKLYGDIQIYNLRNRKLETLVFAAFAAHMTGRKPNVTPAIYFRRMHGSARNYRNRHRKLKGSANIPFARRNIVASVAFMIFSFNVQLFHLFFIMHVLHFMVK
jgi:hypothetical protein